MSVSKGEPDIGVSIKVRYGDITVARAIQESTMPDNFKAPPETIIVSRLYGAEIRITIRSSKGIGSLISTLDDLLSCIQAEERSVIVSNKL